MTVRRVTPVLAGNNNARSAIVDGLRIVHPLSDEDWGVRRFFFADPREAREFRQEDIGYLTKPVHLTEWITVVRSRYAFIAQLDVDERRWAECNERDLYEVNTALASFHRAPITP
jgi:hypothetical protein